MIVVDASVLIGFLDSSDHHHLRAEELLTDNVDADLAANSLTLAEVLVAPARDGRLDDASAALQDLDVMELPVPPDTALRLATLRAGTALKAPGCCVLLSAEVAGASLASFDSRLVREAEQRGIHVVDGCAGR